MVLRSAKDGEEKGKENEGLQQAPFPVLMDEIRSIKIFQARNAIAEF